MRYLYEEGDTEGGEVRWTFVLVLVVVIGSLKSALAEEKMVLLCDDRPPFHFLNADGKLDGHVARVVRCTLEKIGQPYEINIVPWKRAQVETERGVADSFFAASRNSIRDNYAQLSGVIIDQHWSWLVLKTNSLDVTSAIFKKEAVVGSWLGSNSLK